MRMRVGSVDCELVDDGLLAVPPEIIFPSSRREAWPPIETDADGRLVLSVNCLLVWSGGQTILVDAGNGNRPGARFAGGGELLKAMSIAPHARLPGVLRRAMPATINSAGQSRHNLSAETSPM